MLLLYFATLALPSLASFKNDSLQILIACSSAHLRSCRLC
jgi:hypothetical protein